MYISRGFSNKGNFKKTVNLRHKNTEKGVSKKKKITEQGQTKEN
jgi:hypothetical protein